MREPRFNPRMLATGPVDQTVNRPVRIPLTRPKHFDDAAVERFAEAMAEKLAQKREEGRGGWEDRDACSNERLSQLLREHVEKGDPVDVANFAMMLHQRGERIS